VIVCAAALRLRRQTLRSVADYGVRAPPPGCRPASKKRLRRERQQPFPTSGGKGLSASAFDFAYQLHTAKSGPLASLIIHPIARRRTCSATHRCEPWRDRRRLPTTMWWRTNRGASRAAEPTSDPEVRALVEGRHQNLVYSLHPTTRKGPGREPAGGCSWRWPSDIPRTLLVKLGPDRLHNMRTLGALSRETNSGSPAKPAKIYAPLSQPAGIRRPSSGTRRPGLQGAGARDGTAEIKEEVASKRSDRETGWRSRLRSQDRLDSRWECATARCKRAGQAPLMASGARCGTSRRPSTRSTNVGRPAHSSPKT